MSIASGTAAQTGATAAPAQATPPAAQLAALVKIHPADNAALEQLDQAAERLIESAAERVRQVKAERDGVSDERRKVLPASDLRKLMGDDPQGLKKSELRGVKAIEQLSRDAMRAGVPAARAADLSAIREIQAALANGRQPTVPPRLGTFSTWVLIFENIHRSIGEGTVPAANLSRSNSPAGDGGRTDPLPSTFWQRPADIPGEDLAAGFGRTERLRFTGSVLEYDEPKTSSGTHPGFHALLNGRECRIKFGEINSEPFTARIFGALGYHVDPTDYAAGLRIRYDRRIFREFNLRQSLKMHITVFGLPVAAIELQPHCDPFRYVLAARFKNGDEVTGAALKQRLLRDPSPPHPEDSPDNFLPDVEASLDYLVLVPANIQFRAGPARNVGPWGFGDLDHQDRREIRGLALLAAWLGWLDSRTENTKLRLDSSKGSVRLEHFLSDLGSGMGRGTGWVSLHGQDPNALTWRFTRPEIVRGPGRMTTPFRIRSFKPVVPTPAFREMTPDDARWMARLIGQLSEHQLRAALVASGYDAAEAALYLEKLVSRRDQMVRDLQLTDDIPLLRPDGIGREISYDPSQDGPFVAQSGSGTPIFARDSAACIRRGRLVSP